MIICDECHSRIVVTLKMNKENKQKALSTSNQGEESTLSITEKWTIVASIIIASLHLFLPAFSYCHAVFSAFKSRNCSNDCTAETESPAPIFLILLPWHYFLRESYWISLSHTHTIIYSLFINSVVMKFCMLECT